MIRAEAKADLCQISLTGMRALMMLGLLIEAPRSLEEIRDKFIQEGIVDKDSSYDIIRIDMNTLRSMGCEISRSCRRTDYKHVLTAHPFSLSITSEQVSMLKKAYKILKEGASIDLLLQYDNLFRKIAKYVCDDDIKEQLCGISALKHINIENLKEYVNDCKVRNTLTIEYRDAGNSKDIVKKIVAQKIEMHNDKIYMFGYEPEKNESLMLPVKRIIRVIERSVSSDDSKEIKPVEVKFFLKNFNSAGIDSCERIIESHDDISQIVQGTYHNEFIAVQRMLSFGSACIVLEPNEIRQKVIDKLLAMKEVYKK